MNAHTYTYSDCISEANKEMGRSHHFANKTYSLASKAADVHAEAAERWFAYARIANRLGSVKVVTFFSGVPVSVQ